MKRLLLAVAVLLLPLTASAQTAVDPPATAKGVAAVGRGLTRNIEDTQSFVEDALWFFKLGDVANVNIYRIASSKPRRETNPTDPNAGNMVIIPVYVFAPKHIDGKAPMLVFAHGGVRGRLTSAYSHIFRELIDRGYVIVSPEYRGSIGHGTDLYNQIDYGGAEIDDTHDARNWAVENLPYVDGNRVGIFGWSHGGFHVLMNIFFWPDDYKVAYAGVPVSDLVQRMGYTGQGYRDTFAEFIGKQPEDNPMEYRKRSPVYHVEKLKTPLLVHTNTNDEDVNVMEVEHLIASLKAAGKKFEYKIYQNAPGAHQFNRIDTKLARDSRREVWNFLDKYLK